MTLEALAAPADLPKECLALKELDFAGNGSMLKDARAGEALAALLMKSPALETLNLRETNAMPEALAALAEMPGDLPTLKEVDFTSNRSMPKDARAGEALATLLMKCPCLQKLDLGETDAKPEALAARAEVCGDCLALKELDFTRNRSMLTAVRAGEALAKLLLKCPAVEKLNLYGTGMTLEALAALADWPGECLALKELYFNCNRSMLKVARTGEALAKLLMKSLDIPGIPGIQLESLDIRAFSKTT